MKKFLLLCCMLAFVFGVWAQERTVSGRVTSAEDGSTLPGVNVLLKGTNNGTVTGSDGGYTLGGIPASGGTLVFSFIGFQAQEAAIGERTVVDVTMSLDITQLSEVVVVGYGTQIKQDLTGNVAKVSGDAIQNVPVTSFEQAIQGRAAGVLVTAQNGKLGQGINVQIRGATSISGSNEPLYVVDGMVINSVNLSSNGAPTNSLADINFNDIESITFQKDAAAAALYGARGSNGVVMITTKRGKAGKTNFTANFQVGSSKPTGYREFINSEQYVELFREAAYNNDLADGFDPINNPADYPGSWLEYAEDELDYMSGGGNPAFDWRDDNTRAETDWNDEAFQDASMTSFDLTANGGNEKTRFYVGGGFSDQDGLLLGNQFRRVSGRANIDHTASDKLSFGLNFSLSKTINNRVSNDNAFSTPLQLVAQAPITPVRDPDGNLYDDAFNPSMFYYPATVEYENSSFVTEVFRNIGAISATYEIVDGLKLKGEYGFDLLTQNENRYWNNLTQQGRDPNVNGYAQSNWNQIFNHTIRTMLTWSKVINRHAIDATGVFEFQETTADYTDAQGQGFPLKELTKLASSATPVVVNSSLNETTFLSYIAKINYKFGNKYLLQLSGRIDGSSRFAPNNKYGIFPAASAGWIISEEDFLADAGPLSFLKLRASYGLTGNAEIGDYQFLAAYSGIAYGGESGLTPIRIPNPDLSWEKTAQMDIGFEFGLFEDRLTGEIDYYDKQTQDLLLDVPVPSTSGFTTQFQNIGDSENKGFELVLNYTIVRNSDLTVRVGGNYANNKNKVLKLDGTQTAIHPTSSRYINSIVVGEPLGVFFGREFAGADPATGDAIWYVNDTDPDATTNSFSTANRIVLGNPTPTSIYGFHADASFKGFDLNVLFQGVAGNDIFNAGGTFMSANMRFEDNQTIDQLKRWQQPGDITMVPQARLYANNGAQASSRWLEDGSYLRLKTVTLGYNFPQAIANRMKLESLRLYMSGQNLLTFTEYTGWDPEVNTDFLAGGNQFLANDFYAAPQPKNLIFGIKVGF